VIVVDRLVHDRGGRRARRGGRGPPSFVAAEAEEGKTEDGRRGDDPGTDDEGSRGREGQGRGSFDAHGLRSLPGDEPCIDTEGRVS
jgi:hypothetical protein